MKKNRLLIVFSFLFCCSINSFAQRATIFGKVTDNNNKPLEFVNIVLGDGKTGTSTDKSGNYELSVPADTTITASASFLGYDSYSFTFTLKNNERKRINISIVENTTNIQGVTIEDNEVRSTTFERLDPKMAQIIPNASGDIGALIKTLPGVTSTNELSSQYSVRGGNYDENIVYVNGIEVFRPYLTRTGQHEGLSFVNPDLVSSLSFSAGGFEARYGDKMSSVLDITYKTPTEFHASGSISLMSASLHVEDKINKFTYLVGARQKSNSILLNTMDTKGQYKPSFTDVQALLTYTFSKNFNISVLGNYSRNSYKLVPETRVTESGTSEKANRMTVYMEGYEHDKFNNGMGAVSFNYNPNINSKISFILSAYQSVESEKYDIFNDYYLSEIETEEDSDSYGEESEPIGTGVFITHGRNYYQSGVYTADVKGSSQLKQHSLQWGVQYRFENVYDKIDKWKMVDSAGYNLPKTPDSLGYINPSVQPDYSMELKYNVKAINTLQLNRVSAYVQDSWKFYSKNVDFNITYGIRAAYLDVNNEFNISPRLTFSAYPTNWKQDILFRFSTGYYFQPPGYKEMLDKNGILHTDIKSQKSIHFVAGMDWNFDIWNRPFKFITDVYYKHLTNLIPYTIDNVIIQYHPELTTNGYATGIDMKLVGELVKGVDSWISLSLMNTKDRIGDGNYYLRPSDQLVNFSIFLQDYIPKYPKFKVQINLMIGTGLPIYTSEDELFTQEKVFKYTSYKRVDLGLGWQIVSDETQSKWQFLNKFSDVSLVAEVLNLLDIRNKISYTWVTDIYGISRGIPDYLTPIMFNLKLSVKY
ncbi:TonB-dependent receptor [Odoribacter sp. OttesenSCG-928-L07]|nr:TonB-dependent receptor [Odoribacter sp. OttesenSCG-928-L07]MDL2238602.1 TonB-dependent receptor [Bacteroidales bacterium OttesenSCG-928-L14]MDL2240916.1 TonB-dependent receptor [Bacteroidales bacterium OttesenSCG-928-K22]